MSSDDLEPIPDELARLMADCDAALAAGATPLLAPGEFVSEMEAATDCLRLLNRAWGRGLPAVTTAIGRFRVVRELGRGGHGIVFLAVDPDLDRRVAIKVPRPEVLVSIDLARRFLQEGEAAARLEHPNVVPVYEIGRSEAFGYIVSAYCDGPSLDQWLRDRSAPVPALQAARLIAELTDGVQHAHDRGLLHRDIKPGNIMLAQTERPPSSPNALPFVPRLTDFGLARLLEAQEGDLTRPGGHSPDRTCTGALLGTPKYMAPEQADGRIHQVGPATDVYALGAVLYEVLCGRPPFVGESDLKTLQAIASDDPVAPRVLRRDLPRDLESICLKCLEKDPARRYATAAELGADLRRFLAGEPTRARPVPLRRLLGREMRRRPRVAAILACVCAAALAGLAVIAWHFDQLHRINSQLVATAVREMHSAEQAREQADLARAHAYASDVRLSGSLLRDGQTTLLWDVLNRHRPANELTGDQRGFVWRYLWDQGRQLPLLRGHVDQVESMSVTADGRFLISTGRDATIKRWEATTGRLISDVRLPGGGSMYALSADGRRLATVFEAGPDNGRHYELRLWNTSDGSLAARSPVASRPSIAAINATGTHIAFVLRDESSPARLIVWNVDASARDTIWTEAANVHALRFSPDGQRLCWACNFTAPNPSSVGLFSWDLRRQRLAWKLPIANTPHLQLAYSADGALLATGNRACGVDIFESDSGRKRYSWSAGAGQIGDLAILPDGQSVAVLMYTETSGKWASSVEYRQLDGTRQERVELPGHQTLIVPTPDGARLALASVDGSVYLLDRRPAPHPDFTWNAHTPFEAWTVAFLPDNHTLISGGDDHVVRPWDAATGRPRLNPLRHDSLVTCVAVAPNGKTFATGGYDGFVRVFDAADLERKFIVKHGNNIRAVAFSPDGELLASTGRDHVIRLWDPLTGAPRGELDGHAGQINGMAFTPDGRLISVGTDTTVRLWDIVHRRLLLSFSVGASVRCVAVAPDGRHFATGDEEGLVRLWDMSAGTVMPLYGHSRGGIRSLAFSPDCKTLVTGGADRTVRLWQAATGHELIRFSGLPDEVHGLAFSPDGETLAAALHNGSIRLWRAPANQ